MQHQLLYDLIVFLSLVVVVGFEQIDPSNTELGRLWRMSEIDKPLQRVVPHEHIGFEDDCKLSRSDDLVEIFR